jgi:hypothetical protein
MAQWPGQPVSVSQNSRMVMFDKIARSWNLAGQCWAVLKEDPELLVFPLFSTVAMILLLASFTSS